MSILIRFRFIVSHSVLLISLFVLINNTHAQININETFKTSTIDPSIIRGGTATFTAGNEDPEGDGWCRLTNSEDNQAGCIFIDKNLPSNLGVRIDFEYKTWRYRVPEMTGADGFSVFLYDASVPFQLGAYGGSLGYAPGPGALQGLAGGYVGIGFDEYGNFSNPTQGRNGGPGLQCNSVTLRGASTNFPATTNPYLTSVQLQPNELSTVNSIGYPNMTPTRPSDGLFYRRVKINIIPTGSITNPRYMITVSWRTSPDGNDVTLLTHYMNTPPPANLKLGFAASSAGHVNCHEIRNLVVNTPVGFSVNKTVDKSTPKVGEKVTYTVNVLNSTAAPVSNLLFADSIKLDGILATNNFTLNSITFSDNGTVGNIAAGYVSGTPVTTGLTNPLSTSLTMQPNSSCTFTIAGTIKNDNTLEGKTVLNTAFVDPSQTGIDNDDLSDNKSTAVSNIAITTPDLLIQKTVDKLCANPTNGNTYTIIVSNNSVIDINKTNPTPIIVTDSIPPGFTIMGVSAVGWTTSNTGNYYRFTRSGALLAGASFEPIIIKARPSTAGLAWTNKAYVTTQATINEIHFANNKSSVTITRVPPTPILTSPIRYNQGDIASPLSTGKNLIWYTSVGSTGSATAPTPRTDTPGTTSYYVSQTNGSCESSFAKIDVIVAEVDFVPACDSYTAVDGKIYTISGLKTVTGKNIAGNDSVYQINLIVKRSTTSTQYIEACDSYTDSDGIVYTTSQVLTKVVPNVAGCDSTIITNLTVNQSPGKTIDVTTFNSYTAPDGQVHTTPGIKTAIIDNPTGCDSIITINLKINTASSIAIERCETYTAPDGNVYDTSGIVTATIPNSTGSDSIITITLTITYGAEVPQTVSLFQGESYTINGHVYDKKGEYTDVLTSVNGCDSTVFTTIQIIDYPNTITPNNDGRNDEFMPGWPVKIYNRNGILLHEGDNGWDGTHNGKPVSQGTYFFVLYLNSESKTKDGFVTVVR